MSPAPAICCMRRANECSSTAACSRAAMNSTRKTPRTSASTPSRSTCCCSPMRTSITAAAFRCWSSAGFAARSSPRQPRVNSPVWCYSTPPICRKRRPSATRVTPTVAATPRHSRSTPRSMRSMPWSFSAAPRSMGRRWSSHRA